MRPQSQSACHQLVPPETATGVRRVGAGTVAGGLSDAPAPWERFEGEVDGAPEPPAGAAAPGEGAAAPDGAAPEAAVPEGAAEDPLGEEEDPAGLPVFDVADADERPGTWWATTPAIAPTAAKAPAVVQPKTRLTRSSAYARLSGVFA
jgi:hypothetical protein